MPFTTTELRQAFLDAVHAGRLDRAEAVARALVSHASEDAFGWKALGSIHLARQHYELAQTMFRESLARDPHDAETLAKLGQALGGQGQHLTAVEAYELALALGPEGPLRDGILNNLGLAHQESGDETAAENCFRAAWAKGQHAGAAINLAGLLHRQERFHEAAEVARRALALAPDDPSAHYCLGLALLALDEAADAVTALREAVRRAPNHVGALTALGGALWRSGEAQAALAALDTALALAPGHAEALVNRGVILGKLGQLESARACLRQAVARAPGLPRARLNLALNLLAQGDFEEGWPLYESRIVEAKGAYGPDFTVRPDLPLPEWRGEDLAGRGLMLLAEQGAGDLIQFVRFVPLLRARGLARLVLHCPPALAALFRAIPGVDAILERPEDAEGVDYWCFYLSLPARLGTRLGDLPATLPYLAAPPEQRTRWAGRLPVADMRVGLVWRGNPHQRNDRHRSLPGLATLAPLWAIAGVRFFSLQKGPGAEEAAMPPPGQPLIDLAPHISDFADTAAIIELLDLVVSVDTSVAHLAGALGKRCWVLLSATAADWRYPDAREDTPWYPGALRLFRQTRPGDWVEPVARLAEELAARVAERAD